MALAVGSLAPDFALRSQRGELVRLSDVAREHVVVLFFYPRDDTPVCTKEACAFRDSYQVFRDAGAEVLGISADPVESHQRFASKHGLGFQLLSDPDRAVRRLYHVEDTVPLFMPGRVTFVIDRERVIRHRFSSQFKAAAHVKEALDVVAELRRAT